MATSMPLDSKSRPSAPASGPADSDSRSRPSAPGLRPSRPGPMITSLGSGPRAQPTRTDSAPAHAGPDRPRDAWCHRHQTTARCTVWGDPTVSAWSCVPVEDAALPTPALGATRPPPRGSGSQRAATADPAEPGPGPSRPPLSHADPPTTNRSRASAPFWQVLGEHGANYVDAGTPLRQRASPPRLAPPSVARMA